MLDSFTDNMRNISHVRSAGTRSDGSDGQSYRYTRSDTLTLRLRRLSAAQLLCLWLHFFSRLLRLRLASWQTVWQSRDRYTEAAQSDDLKPRLLLPSHSDAFNPSVLC